VSLQEYPAIHLLGLDMETQLVSTFAGPNIYCDSPAVLINVSLPEGLQRENRNRNKKICSVLAGFLHEVGQSSSYPSLSRLHGPEHKTLVHIHLWLYGALAEALEMAPQTIRLVRRDASSYQVLISWQVVEGITVGLCSFTVGFLAKVATLCQSDSVHLLENLDLPQKLEEFGHRKHAQTPDISAQLIIDECFRRNIPVIKFMDNNRCIQLGQGFKRVHILESASSKTSLVGHKLSTSKVATTSLLRQYGVPAPDNTVVGDTRQAAQVAKRMGYPVVVKPNAGGKGVGITVGVQNEAELSRAFKIAESHGSGVLVETLLPGDDHRILVVDYEMVAVAKRIPAAVQGDGEHTVAQLIESENRNPLRGVGYEKAMNTILIQDEVHRMLSVQGLSLESVPERDVTVQLRGNANISTGGTVEDVTSIIHPDNKRAAETAARLMDLKLVGVDFLCPDISRSYREVGGGICELNTGAGIPIHDIGKKESCVAQPVVNSYFGQDDGRIPTALLIGSENIASIADILQSVLQAAGHCVGKATRDGTWIGAEQYESGDCTNVNSVRQMLVDPLVEAAIFEASAGRILSQGLGLDRSTVSLVTGISSNQGVPPDAVSPEAVAARSARVLTVLNGDSANCSSLRQHVRSEQVCLVRRGPGDPQLSLDPENDFSCIFSDSLALFALGAKTLVKISAEEIPGLKSATTHDMQSIAYCIPLAWGMGATAEQIRSGLTRGKGSGPT